MQFKWTIHKATFVVVVKMIFFFFLLQCLFAASVKLITTGQRQMADTCYTPEQAALVQKVRSCRDNHEMMGLSRNCSR